MAERSKKITLAIFLFSIFIFLGIIIFVFMYSTTTSSRNYTKEMTMSSVECLGITFRVVGDTISYDGSALSFMLESSGGGSPSSLIVETGNTVKKLPELNFGGRLSRKITIKDIEIEDKFLIYPEGCKSFNLKECNLTDCVRLK